MSIRYLNALPNLFTLGNLLCGFLAVAAVIHGSHEALISASWWIIIAAILDALDGKVARLTGTSSEFGVEFDSIADVVSFGLAPAALVYRYSFAGAEKIGLIFSFCFLAAGAIRLARFNVTAGTVAKSHFTGMPIPAGAGIVAAYILFSDKVWPAIATLDVAVALVVMTSIAMVSRFRYGILPKIGFRSTKGTVRSSLLIANIFLIALFPDEILFPEGVLYLLSGPLAFLSAPALVHVFHRANHNR
jgi:CDP-diacylglycerol---serine O-phosphatidyltransferase